MQRYNIISCEYCVITFAFFETIICVAYCIFDMTSYESFSLIENGPWNLKQLVLVTFLLLQDLYVLSYHPSNPTSFEIPEILTEIRLKTNLLNIEIKITRYIHYTEFLQNYQGNRKYPTGFALKFNLHKYIM